MRTLLPLLLLAACQDYDLKGTDGDGGSSIDSGDDSDPGVETGDDEVCEPLVAEPVAVALEDACDYDIGGFEPIIEWSVSGKWSTALPVVGDLDGDGMPEVVVIWGQGLMAGRLAVYHGDGSGLVWENPTDNMGYGSAPALADLDGDGSPEVLVVKEYASGLWSSGDYTVLAYRADGTLWWESEHFVEREMDYATGIIVSDMDHDGSPEVVAGGVILSSDGATRMVAAYPVRGCPTDSGIEWIAKEGTFPAVADLDLDGEEELITGNTIFRLDGTTLWRNATYSDGSIAVANLDDDPEGEFVVAWGNTIRAHDTNGDLLWGPRTNPTANIFPVPAVGDVDADGHPEIVVAGGNELWVLRRDGTELWTYPITDMSGATGASIFDFDADGIPEVVYIDEVEMLAFNGADGTVRFRSGEHASVTMYDYPVVADVDADGHAEIVVMDQSSAGLKVFGDATNSWAPVRKVWNQHSYTITNINDDLSVPITAVQNFTVYNSYHSALSAPPGEALEGDLKAEIVDICQDDCDSGEVRVLVRALNAGGSGVDAGLSLALYARNGTTNTLVATTTLPDAVPSEWSSPGVELIVDAAALEGAEGLYLVVDDDGTGTGAIAECLEDNNGHLWDGPFCY